MIGPYTEHLRDMVTAWRDVPRQCIKAAGPHNFRPPKGQIEAAWLDTVLSEYAPGGCILEINGARFAVVPWPRNKG